ncbi:MAG: mechanosensitive ion channel family protein [Synechococcus sp.]|nr:mechanosensitive ion channel family protein [Synechococcus sp.]
MLAAINLASAADQDFSFFQTDLGVAIGSLGLLLLWAGLTLLSRHGRRGRSQLAKAALRPLMLGLSAALYCGWLIRLLSSLNIGIQQGLGLQLSTSLFVLASSWAMVRLGKTVLHSQRFSTWLTLEDPKDEAMLISLLDRLFVIAVIVLCTAGLMVTFGVSSTAVATMLGGAGIGIGFGTQHISQNFLSGFMLFFNRPFKEGDWISTSGLEGTVEKIGWYHTKLRTFERRPLYIPNAVFATNPIENPGQMYNRRIKASISLRYEDLPRMASITSQIRTMLSEHPDIDQKQVILVNFNQWDSSSVNIQVYCFTHTTVWKDWLDIQQEIFLTIATIIQQAGADFAFPSTTLYPAPALEADHPIRKLNVA